MVIITQYNVIYAGVHITGAQVSMRGKNKRCTAENVEESAFEC